MLKKSVGLLLLCTATFTLSKAGASQEAFNIRTITAGVTLSQDNWKEVLIEASDFLVTARQKYESRGYTVQGVRLSTNPFTDYTDGLSVEETVNFIRKLDDFAQKTGLGLAIGPVSLDNQLPLKTVERITKIIKETTANVSIIIADKETGIHTESVRTAAEVMLKLGELNTVSNFQFAATANLPPETPFFPGAFHQGEKSSFSIGTESAQLVMDVFAVSENMENARSNLLIRFEEEFKAIEKIATEIQNQTGWPYMGVDTSPAPLKNVSIGQAIENLIKSPFGTSGTMAACALITGVIQSVDVQRAGYSGLMLPVMEDVVLADRASEGRFGINDLLAWSAVCGTGLDVIPIPGDVSVEQVERILVDVAAMALRLDKPLSARLIPVKGKDAGERVALDSPYLVPTTIFPVE